MSRNEICRGVRELDHMADVGISVRASSREELFQRAANGMFALVFGDDRRVSPSVTEGSARERSVELQATDLPALLVRWLRELLYLHEVEGTRYSAASFEQLNDTRLRARVRTTAGPAKPVREIKGVTYHELTVAHDADGWRARLVFDV